MCVIPRRWRRGGGGGRARLRESERGEEREQTGEKRRGPLILKTEKWREGLNCMKQNQLEKRWVRRENHDVFDPCGAGGKYRTGQCFGTLAAPPTAPRAGRQPATPADAGRRTTRPGETGDNDARRDKKRREKVKENRSLPPRGPGAHPPPRAWQLVRWMCEHSLGRLPARPAPRLLHGALWPGGHSD